jgi:hypothetical protein
MIKKKIFLTALVASIAFHLSADEGMWMLQLLKQQKYPEMRALGLKLTDYDIYNPDGSSIKDAVVQFGNGCTGEVISSQGLVLTNHHCGYGSIQNHSSLKNNYLEEGFWAMSREQELPNPGLTVTFIERIDDVTDFVKQCLERDSAKDSLGVFYLSPSYLKGVARERVGEVVLKNLQGIDFEIKPFYHGNRYYMFTKKIYSDVRLVGAPPSSIGKFGADTDNWMWPRHTGDFSVFRIYADKDGNPAPYSPSNVPLKPKRWLTISSRGIQENDFAMIIGFPGTTYQYFTSWEVQERRDIDNAVRINIRNIRQKAMLEEMLKDPAVKIQYSSKYAGSTNGYKSAIGANWAIDKHNFVDVKLRKQLQLQQWARNNNRGEYVSAIDAIRSAVDQRANLRFRERMLSEAILMGIEFSKVRYTHGDSLLQALSTKDKAAIEKYTDALQSDYRLFANKDYNPQVDQKVSTALLSEYVRLVPRNEQPSIFDELYSRFDGDVGAFVQAIFSTSIFGSEQNLQRFLASKRKDKLLKSDLMFRFAQSVNSEYDRLQMQLNALKRPYDEARKKYVEGILEMDGELNHFPDANLTLRLTYGKVKGYRPRDAVFYGYQTTMDGIMEKEDSTNWEFVVPEKLKYLYKNSDFGTYAMPNGKMPVAFIADTHTTGGNSGSPVMNGNGELVGINFDRNWEGVGGDIQYLPDFQRSIIVDIRYVLFVIEHYAGAKHLIDEMDIDKIPEV